MSLPLLTSLEADFKESAAKAADWEQEASPEGALPDEEPLSIATSEAEVQARFNGHRATYGGNSIPESIAWSPQHDDVDGDL